MRISGFGCFPLVEPWSAYLKRDGLSDWQEPCVDLTGSCSFPLD